MFSIDNRMRYFAAPQYKVGFFFLQKQNTQFTFSNKVGGWRRPKIWLYSIKIVSFSVCSFLKFSYFFLYRCSEKFSHFLHVLSGVIQTARTGSVYVTLGVTIERYFAIVHPFKCFKLKKILLPSAILFAIIYNIPKVKS